MIWVVYIMGYLVVAGVTTACLCDAAGWRDEASAIVAGLAWPVMLPRFLAGAVIAAIRSKKSDTAGKPETRSKPRTF